MKVFQQKEIEEICNIASVNGFTLYENLVTETKEKAVRWEIVDKEYTFIFIAFRKS
jgi:ABC-type uncharacterized transport system substrate-binding protein